MVDNAYEVERSLLGAIRNGSKFLRENSSLSKYIFCGNIIYTTLSVHFEHLLQ